MWKRLAKVEERMCPKHDDSQYAKRLPLGFVQVRFSSCGLTIESPDWITGENSPCHDQPGSPQGETSCPSSGTAALRPPKPGLTYPHAGPRGSQEIEADNDAMKALQRGFA